uniref:DDE Tnp4 domain-containing protein n=1 Tax=Musca domestica TaxID=7370 RepID=A0A1I8NL92_MUSDO
METSQLMNIKLLILTLFEAGECLKKLYGRRRYWVRPLLRNRDTHGFFATTFCFPDEFQKTIRMEKNTFDLLLTFVKERLRKHSNRPSISPECRLFMTLAYLAHDGSKQIFSAAFKMGVSTMKGIVSETCEVLWEILGPIYLSVPKENEWKRIAIDFYTMWDLPNCVGAIDGKHINLTCPSNSGSQFYNYKGNYSIVLLAACEANYTFTSVDIGAFGSQSDGGVMWNSRFGQQLYKGQLDLPTEEILPGTNKSFPHYFVADAAFPLKPFLIRPYPGLHEQFIFSSSILCNKIFFKEVTCRLKRKYLINVCHGPVG